MYQLVIIARDRANGNRKVKDIALIDIKKFYLSSSILNDDRDTTLIRSSANE